MDSLSALLSERGSIVYNRQGLPLVSVANDTAGIALAVDILKHLVTTQTLLLLSGGRTPKALYETIAKQEALRPGAVGMVDERYGEKFHLQSNETMMRDAGLLRYLTMLDIPFFPILGQSEESREDTAKVYDILLRSKMRMFPKTVGVLGIGLDGHTAGLPAQNATLLMEKAKVYKTDYEFVIDYADESGTYGERVTMTFLALAQLDFLLVLVFGTDKRTALEAMYSEMPEEVVPGRFYLRPEIAKKTLLITDQKF